MRLLIIRHGDPDYARDSLTEKGWREASLLADRISRLEVRDFFVSTQGRAKDTASVTLKRMNRTSIECDWLREFSPLIKRPDLTEGNGIVWDWLPQDWTKEEDFFLKDKWAENPVMQMGRVKESYNDVVSKFDYLLAEYGYIREGALYRAEHSNRDTLVFFCHFGVGCVLLSHLLNVSPMILWHHTCCAPCSVTTAVSEERRNGRAIFRVTSLGDISHLYAGGEEPSFMARFCETFDSKERHD